MKDALGWLEQLAGGILYADSSIELSATESG